MATVKGDVHDIGKKYRGCCAWVQQLRSYRSRCDGACRRKFLETARKENADIIGVSGLITPSLDEMVHVAGEMEREGSKSHSLSVVRRLQRYIPPFKLNPFYSGPAIHVRDASRSVGVVSHLMSSERQQTFTEADPVREYAEIRERRAKNRQQANLLPFAVAQERRSTLDWRNYQPSSPRRIGTEVFEDYPVSETRWTISTGIPSSRLGDSAVNIRIYWRIQKSVRKRANFLKMLKRSFVLSSKRKKFRHALSSEFSQPTVSVKIPKFTPTRPRTENDRPPCITYANRRNNRLRGTETSASVIFIAPKNNRGPRLYRGICCDNGYRCLRILCRI